ncbi:MAG TPA: glycosyltransferase family 2 protein [Actinomycetota bacterium]|jgi:glycosyltransferase involved in cell wall biosynthesis|nr:glycosyltransferase family 2 protein [Actinomycetota bacterium]
MTDRSRKPAHHPLVSIITPVLNRVDTIKDTLISVAAQTYRPIEHLLMDGGSTDGTVQVIERFAESAPHVRWISEPDSGMYEALGRGLRMARGDIIAYINSDDLYFPWSVEVAVGELRKGCDFVYGDVAILRRGGARRTFQLQFYPEFDARHYIHHGILAQPTVFWTRTAMDSVGGFDAGLRLLGDVDYWTRAVVAGLRFCRVDDVLALMVLHPGALSIRFEEELQEELTRIRASVDPHVHRPRSRVAVRVRNSIRWRRNQFAFRREGRHGSPRRWQRFIRLLHNLGVEVRGGGTLQLLLPGRFLRHRRSQQILDAEEFERKLLTHLYAKENDITS